MALLTGQLGLALLLSHRRRDGIYEKVLPVYSIPHGNGEAQACLQITITSGCSDLMRDGTQGTRRTDGGHVTGRL